MIQIEHPDITRACETGYPWGVDYSPWDEDDDDEGGEGGEDDEDCSCREQDE